MHCFEGSICQVPSVNPFTVVVVVIVAVVVVVVLVRGGGGGIVAVFVNIYLMTL